MFLISPRIEQAAQIALRAHAGQVRKNDGSPYVVHPYMVALLLTSYDFPEQVIVAGLVHDVLEDTGVSVDELTTALGPEVVALVQEVSEQKELPWEERKKRYIQVLQAASPDTKAVSIADKIHNAQSMLHTYEVEGPKLWHMFNRGRTEQLWFMHALLDAYRTNWHHPLIERYADLVAALDQCE
jgi:(p)ppGpp synthase/HD superfamily hydrolase